MVLELVSPTFPIAIGIVGSWSNSEADFGFLLTPILGRIQVKIYIFCIHFHTIQGPNVVQ